MAGPGPAQTREGAAQPIAAVVSQRTPWRSASVGRASGAVRLQGHAQAAVGSASRGGEPDRLHRVAHEVRPGGAARLTSRKEKLIKIGAKVASHPRHVAFRMAEAAIPENPSAEGIYIRA
jgi:hypothetical protein